MLSPLERAYLDVLKEEGEQSLALLYNRGLLGKSVARYLEVSEPHLVERLVGYAGNRNEAISLSAHEQIVKKAIEMCNFGSKDAAQELLLNAATAGTLTREQVDSSAPYFNLIPTGEELAERNHRLKQYLTQLESDQDRMKTIFPIFNKDIYSLSFLPADLSLTCSEKCQVVGWFVERIYYGNSKNDAQNFANFFVSNVHTMNDFNRLNLDHNLTILCSGSIENALAVIFDYITGRSGQLILTAEERVEALTQISSQILSIVSPDSYFKCTAKLDVNLKKEVDRRLGWYRNADFSLPTCASQTRSIIEQQQQDLALPASEWTIDDKKSIIQAMNRQLVCEDSRQKLEHVLYDIERSLTYSSSLYSTNVTPH